MPETTYLELSEDDGAAHKFYEVIVDDAQLTIRYGRIGDQGQARTTTFPSAEQGPRRGRARSSARS